MLHSGKRDSIIAWFNAMTMMRKDFSIQSLLEFCDGKKFIVLISIVNNLKKGILPEEFESSKSLSESKDSDTDKNKEKSSESAKDEKIEKVSIDETDDEKTTEMEIDISTETCVEKTTETDNEPDKDILVNVEDNPNEMNEIDIIKRYEDIKKFIDDFLAYDSSSILVYSECPKGKEIELAKVAVLLLSAMVQSYLSINMEHLYFTTVLDLQPQEDIKECLSLILMETDEPLKKAELHKILGRPSKSKSTPRRRTPSRSTSEVLETPENSKSLSKKKQTKASMAEEIFESPLKNLWDSPKIQLRSGLFKKDMEINKLRDALHIEESKVIDLTIEKRSLNAELEKKKRELEFLKEDQRRALENADEVNAEKSIKLEEHLAEKQKDNKKIHELKEEIYILKKENEKLSSELADLEKLSQKEHTEETNYKQQNKELIEKIKDLELNISLKDGKIKDLKERELSLKSDLKHYRQMLEESNNKIALSPTGLKSFESGNIIYADARDVMKERDKLSRDLSIEQENAKTWKKSCENAEQALLKYENDILKYKNELEKKDQELKYKNETLLVYKSWEESVLKSTKNRVDEEMAENIPLALLPCDNFGSKSSTMESERDNDVKEEPETSTTATIWDTHKDKAMETRSRSGSRRTSASSFSCTNSELNVFKDKIATVTSRMVDIFDKSEVPLLNKLELQAKSCSSLKDVTQYFAIMGSLIDSMKSAQLPPAKRNSVRGTTPRDASGVQNELANIKLKMDDLQKEYKFNLDMKTNELRLAEEKYKALELKIQELNQNLEKSQQDVKDATNKLKMSNQNYQKLLSEQKQLLKLYMALDKEKKSSEEPCKDCPILRKKLSNVKRDRNEYEKDSLELKALVKELESRAKNLERQLQVEIKEKKKLEFKIQRESAFLSGNISDKRAVIHKYFQQGLAESRKAKERKLEVAQQLPAVSANVYILNTDSKEPCHENSMSSAFANRSIRSGFLQTDDEEDFLNHSSLAQIQRETRPESEELTDRRLTEIRRRNTLCLPHLQSSYPLELQNMTPTERKYFEFRRPQPVADDIDSALLDSDESNDVPSYPVNKRKVADMEDTSSQPVKKQARVFPIKRVSKEKQTTPIRKMLYKSKTFKTPTSIRRLMGISRKNN